MIYYAESSATVAKNLGTDLKNGLSEQRLKENRRKYGLNILSPKKEKSLFGKILSCLKEPMLIILLFSFALAFGVNFGKFLKSGEADFSECFGILAAVVLSVAITLIMEGSSKKAFDALSKLYGDIRVKVVRGGDTVSVRQNEITVGDLVIIESGDKVVADGRVIESESLAVNESALTGESNPVYKNADIIPENKPLAERVNAVYSGTFAVGGRGKYIVTATGDNTEMGVIAGEISGEKAGRTPLDKKLAKLGKIITAIGVLCALSVFTVSVIRLWSESALTFDSLQNLFVSCIILIVAAVPEGLPTIVALSLALNMIKLAGENALIKKMTATETAGAVSVICSDKTGTLTTGKMAVHTVCYGEFCSSAENIKKEAVIQNFICNSTAEAEKTKDDYIRRGSGTECALLIACLKSGIDYKRYRSEFPVVDRTPFSSDNKYMSTTVKTPTGIRVLYKGAPEKIIPLCNLSAGQRGRIISAIEKEQKKAMRVLCFAHDDGDGVIYDAFASISDEIRPEAFSAVKECKKAGIKVKILTGDNYLTACAIAVKLGVASSEREVISAETLENMSDEDFKKLLPKITVIARSTPLLKLRVVKLLKECGEVVAVTGDGINDAPAIKRADVGFCMGRSGSEITKESADIVLLDDSFKAVVKAIAFGRNVYKNLQRFILFQLSVNLSALLFITLCSVFSIETPFNTLGLLWINVIMDGPPALTLGLERVKGVMKEKPVSRSKSIVTLKMLARIILTGVFVSGVLFMQYRYNFLGVKESERSAAAFTLFIAFQLFNAFNCRELGGESILKSLGKNKIMAATFTGVFLAQIIMVQFAGGVFGVSAMSFISWLKIVGTASSVIIISEIYKAVYRAVRTLGVFGFFAGKSDKRTKFFGKINKKSVRGAN